MQPVRTIVFDPKNELRFPGVTPCTTPEALQLCMRDAFIHYVPASFDRDQLEEACQVVWLTPGPYVWWIDEGSELSSPGYCPAGLRLGVTQGRQAKKMVIVLTQRLAEIHPVFRSQSEHIFIFTPSPIELDLKTVAGNVRREWRVLEKELTDLHKTEGDFSHLWYCRDTDELRRCAPIPTGAASGRQAAPATATVDESSQSPPCEDLDSS